MTGTPRKVGWIILLTSILGGSILIRTQTLSTFLRRAREICIGQKGNNTTKCEIRPVERIVQRGFTKEQLIEYNGEKRREIYVGVKHVVYEVAPQFYGPGQQYHTYAGREISRCLAKSDLTGNEANKGWVHDCSQEELDTLEQWANVFQSKYPVVGWFVPDGDSL